jgi:hypothetical protein
MRRSVSVSIRSCVALVCLHACSATRAEPPAADDAGSETGAATSSGSGSTESTDGGRLDGTSTQGESDSTGAPNCGEIDYQLTAIPPNVVLVLDKSGSMVSDADADADGVMDGYWDHDADPSTELMTRWRSLHRVVDSIVAGLDARIHFGAMLFPATDATDQYSAAACSVAATPEIPVAPMNAAAVLAGIPAADATDLHGATPATAGIEAAVAHLETLDPDVPRYLVLVTDGAANCSSDAATVPDLLELYDQHLPEVVADALASRAIPTYVVGIDIRDELAGVGADGMPEANTFAALHDVALAGGRPRPGPEAFYAAGNELELMDALSEIAGEVLTCVVPLDPVPLHPDFVTVEIDGESLERVADCESERGWDFVDPDGPYDALRLCGSACDLLVDIGTADVTYGCPPVG